LPISASFDTATSVVEVDVELAAIEPGKPFCPEQDATANDAAQRTTQNTLHIGDGLAAPLIAQP
jgi:hypothetical protein